MPCCQKAPVAVWNSPVGTVTQHTFVKRQPLIVNEARNKQPYRAFASYAVYLSPDGGERKGGKKEAFVLPPIRDEAATAL